MPILVGTSGWQYADWRGSFYPADIPKTHWLEYYASQFPTVEVNNAFYRLPGRSTFEDWANRTPPAFAISVKASRYLTHVKRLREPEEPVARLLDRAQGLGAKLGPFLLQLPPTLRKDLASLDQTLQCFPKGVRVAVEPRHPSWLTDDLGDLLAAHNAAYCLVDRPYLRGPRWRTSDWGYVRFHEGRANPHPCYGRQALRNWVQLLGSMFGNDPTVYAYFNNDALGCAPRNARSFERLARSLGL